LDLVNQFWRSKYAINSHFGPALEGDFVAINPKTKPHMQGESVDEALTNL
jgi:hypothetical protein